MCVAEGRISSRKCVNAADLGGVVPWVYVGHLWLAIGETVMVWSSLGG